MLLWETHFLSGWILFLLKVSKNISLVYTMNLHTCFHLHLLTDSASGEDSKPSAIKELLPLVSKYDYVICPSVTILGRNQTIFHHITAFQA